MIVGLADDRVQVFQSLHDTDGHLAAVTGHVRTRIESCPEAFANFFHSDFQLLTLVNDTEILLVCSVGNV